MYSDALKAALEREVVGQAPAVDSVVRGVTRVVSGLTPRERPLCSWMFLGPTGTGKSHLIRALARILHGSDHALAVADCTHLSAPDPWASLMTQVAPLYLSPCVAADGSVPPPRPLSVISIEYLERAPAEVARALAVGLETGLLPLPNGRSGSLRNCLLFVTSGLCTKEILDDGQPLGFTGSQDEHDKEAGRLREACLEQAAETFGTDLIGRLDARIIFHKLSEVHLAEILDLRLARVNRWLSGRGVQCELRQPAREFLIARGRHDLRLGARDLVRAHQRYVEFPLADLLVSGRIPCPGLVDVVRREGEEHLHFTIREIEAPTATGEQAVPVVWKSGGATPVAVAR